MLSFCVRIFEPLELLRGRNGRDFHSFFFFLRLSFFKKVFLFEELQFTWVNGPEIVGHGQIKKNWDILVLEMFRGLGGSVCVSL